MNVSEKVKHVWWATMRCGTRSVSVVLQHYDFFNYQKETILSSKSDIRYTAYTHELDVPETCINYPVIAQIRNPYSRALSHWHLNCFKTDPLDPDKLVIEQNLSDYITQTGIMQNISDKHIKHKPKYLIRYEHLEKDLLELPFIDLTNPTVKFDFEDCILKNSYKCEGVERVEGSLTRSSDTRYALWQSYYNAKLASIVYEKYALEFELFNYDKNSWKL